MTRFIIGLLLGLLLGIGGTAAFLITAGGGDYLITQSPRVRELEASLKNVDTDRQWLRSRLNESNETLAKLESRFSALAARFESLSGGTHDGAAVPAPTNEPSARPTPSGGGGGDDGGAAADPPPAADEKADGARAPATS